MPTFPVYPGELPTCLDPWNLRHYSLLAYWIFFRPTNLKCYLRQIDPILYRTTGGFDNFLKTFKYPAYRNLYILIILISLILAFSLSGGLITLYWVNNEMVQWSKIQTIFYGIAFGVVSSVVVSTTFGIAFGIASSFAIIMAICGTLAVGVIFSLKSLLGQNNLFGQTAFMIGLIAGSIPISAALSITLDIVSSAVLSIVLGIILGCFGGATLGHPGYGLFGGMVIIVVFLRLPLYLLLLGWSLFCKNKPNQHPAIFYELNTISFPYATPAIKRILQQGEIKGYSKITATASNPFRYASLQRALHEHLHNHSTPINYLYHLLCHPNLDNYTIIPISESQWRDSPSIRDLFLREIGGITSTGMNILVDSVCNVTKHRRNLKLTQLNNLAALFYNLLAPIENEFLDSDRYIKIYLEKVEPILKNIKSISKYPGGAEVYTSHTLFRNSLKCKNIEDIPLSQINLSFPLPKISSAIRPRIINSQLKLQAIAQNIQSALTMTSRVNQFEAYAIANEDLRKLHKYVADDKTIKPEQTVLLLIIKHWTELIIIASGSIARTEITELVANPYVAGTPVTGNIFVGRTDILRRIEELWMAEKPPSLVIYGHRRMGKSSILLNLQGKLNKDTILIDFNMQRVGLVDSTAELLHNLALRLYDALEPSIRSTWTEPEFTIFSSGNVYNAFDRFLTQLDRYRNGKRFAVAIDEFELIETQIEQGILEPRLLSYFLGILQTYSWLFFAFAGLHTLEEMTRNYWEPLFAKVTRISVSFLEPAVARQLITQPTPDFNLDYAEDAIELIIQLTAGQPYLIQLICLSLVSRFNDQNFISASLYSVAKDRDKNFKFKVEDVEIVIQNNEFESNGSAYFRGIWDRADSNQHLILRQLASDDLGLSQLLAKVPLAPEQIRRSLENLQAHDVLAKQQDKYIYCVPLMRRWVAKHK